MPSIGFNAHVDRLGYYASLPDAGSSWIVVLLRSTNLENDATLADHDDLAALLLGTTDEAVFQNYERKPVVPTRTVRDDSNSVLLGLPEIVWTQAGSSTGGQNDTVQKCLVCYKPSANALDSAILPLVATQIQATTDGNDMRLRHPNGLAVVSWVQAA